MQIVTITDIEAITAQCFQAQGWKQSEGGWVYDHNGIRRGVDWLEIYHSNKAQVQAYICQVSGDSNGR